MQVRLRSYFLRQAFQNIRDHLTVHLLGLGTMISSLLILGIFLMLYANVGAWIHGWQNSLSFYIYLSDDISAYKRDKIDSFLRGLPGTQSLRYISKEEAMFDLKKMLGSDAVFLDRLMKNPLPASYELLFDYDQKQVPESEAVKSDLLAMEGVEEVQTSQDWPAGFKQLMDIVEIIFFVVGGLLCLCIILIMINTIKLTLFHRKSEIEILKLVGATDWFIKVPFLLEGTIQGISAGLLTVLILRGGYWFFATKEIAFLDANSMDLVFLSIPYLLLLLSISIALGMIGSLIALSRFFKV